MPAARLSALDASFLEVESPTAHMHVGWVASFASPGGGRPPTFTELRSHIESRLCRAPRYRQRLARVPLGVHDPLWVDDDDFDCARHLHEAAGSDLSEIADAVMSAPLARDRPLWEMWIAPGLPEGQIGLVGKAHHCLVDGMAAVELASLLLDATPEPEPAPSEDWRPAAPPGPVDRLAGGIRDRLVEQLGLVATPVRTLTSPRRVIGAVGSARRAAGALASSLGPATADTVLNQRTSPERHLALHDRPLDDLRRVKAHFQTTLNDVVLAACAGGMRRFLQRRGEQPRRLKTMVPVSVRDRQAGGDLGNRISFMFVDLPCDEPDPVTRLYDVYRSTSSGKRAGEPEGADAVLKAVSYAPRALQHLASRLAASERTFNLTISNIPGPPQPLYMLGCRLEKAYPVVPLADRHALAIGMHTNGGRAFFGIHADREALPDSDHLAADIAAELDELVDLTG